MKRCLLFMLMALFAGSSHAQKIISSHTIGNEPRSYARILVIVKTQNATSRMELEDDIVARLQKKDIVAAPSHVRIPNKVLKAKWKDEEAIETFVSALRTKGFEGILVTSLVEASQSVEYNPGQYQTRRVPVRYGRFGRYYGTTRVAVYKPGSVEKTRNLVLESLLYDLRGSTKENSLHWMGKVAVTDPANYDKMSDKYAKTVVKRLTKEAID